MTSSEHRSPSSTRSDRRGLVLAVAGCLVATSVILVSSGQRWLLAELPAEPPLPGVSQEFSGGEAVDVLMPIGLLVGAAGLALIATGRIGRLVIGVVLVAAGTLLVVAIGFFLYDDGVSVALSWAQAYAPPGGSVWPERDLAAAPAVVALIAGAIALAVGLLAIAGSRRWPVMGARYERGRRRVPSENAATVAAPGSVTDAAPAVNEATMWTALDRGEDPTASPPRPGPSNARETPPDRPPSGR